MVETLPSTALMLLVGAYLLGSISCAVLVCRLLGLEDPRQRGSHNPGATNVLRIGGSRAALLTLIGDFGKGWAPVILALALQLPPFWVGLIGLAALAGHLSPLFFRFHGGKGVATFLGICLGFDALLGLAQLGCWLVVALLFRISSLAALVTALASPLLCYWLALDYLAFTTCGALLVMIRHRRNIIDLHRGREGRL